VVAAGEKNEEKVETKDFGAPEDRGIGIDRIGVIVGVVDPHETTIAVLHLLLIIMEEGVLRYDEMILVARLGRHHHREDVEGPIPGAAAAAAADRIRVAAAEVVPRPAADHVAAAPARIRRTRPKKIRSTARISARSLSTSSS
jgi:hypothetical protein